MNINNYLYLKRYSLGKKGAIDAYKTAILNQRMDESALKALVWEKTKKLVSHAYENVTWYKDKFSELACIQMIYQSLSILIKFQF